MDPELFGDFIVEAKEHLETIEPNLLELEKSPDNLSLLNEIFRPMHSLKGASGFLGLNKMNVLAHKAENILDELRKGTMAVTSEIMDVILSATDALRQMIDNLETQQSEGDVDTAPITEILDALMAGGSAPPAAKPAKASGAIPPGPEPACSAEENTAAKAPGGSFGSAGQEAPEHAAASGSAKVTIDMEAWLASRPAVPAYALTAFGEGHLKDFIEESKENTSNLNEGLLELEKHPDGQTELVNDLFRYFHNLKGNSGIIGFNELNAMTHEAETLLNNVRKGNLGVTPNLVDLLLFVVDVLEALITRIDPASGNVSPFDASELMDKLKQAVSGGAIEMPAPPHAAEPAPGAKDASQAAAEGQSAECNDDLPIFEETIKQQMNTIASALEGARKDGTNREYPDALFRSLSTIQNCCGFIGLEEIKTYTGRTAGIVDQGRATDMDFSMLADLLEQECAIIRDMIADAVVALKAQSAQASANKESAAAKAPVEAEKPGAKEKPAEADAAAVTPAPAKPKAEGKSSAQPPKAEDPKTAAPAKPAAAPAASAAAGKDDGSKISSTIRVDHEKLDHLMNLIGELIINRNRYSMLARQMEDEANLDIGAIAQNLSETTYAMARISDDLQDTIMKVRMMPVSSVFSRFPRLVRDLSRKSGKEVDLIMEGEETELDKSVVEVIGDPLVHLIRNSMDHGIEPEDVRRERGKSPKGRVWLRAYYKGNSVAIEIEDDGKGIDPEKMREVAVRKGVITAEDAKALDDREAIELIFAPGFSSAEVVTDISGRGVGMDVVRTNIKNLKGSISIASEVGKGTKFTLSLPLTLAIIDALMVEVDDQMYAIPLDAVSETTKIEARRLTDVKGRKAVTLRGDILGIVALSEMLGLPNNMANQDILSVVVIHDQERRLGLVVDRLLERQEVVIKPLGTYLGDLKGLSGATILGDGSVILILDPHEIYVMATSKSI